MNLFAKQKEIHRYRKQMYEYQAQKEGQDELGDWDRHKHTIDTMYHSIDN